MRVNPGIGIKIYRIERWFYEHGMRRIAKGLGYMLYLITNCVIPPSVKIGQDTQLPQSVGIVIHLNTIIGQRCRIYQNVTIGNAGPIIGDDVIIGAGAVILGAIRIGNKAKIGANAVVLEDVPAGATVVGIPAKVVKIRQS